MAFAIVAGGSLDLRVTPKLQFVPMQGVKLLTGSDDAANDSQNNLRLSATPLPSQRRK
jgi:hypothetical protein